MLRGHPKVISRLRATSPEDIAISTVTSYELFTGVKKCAHPERELKKLELLLSTVHELPFLATTAREAARVRADLEADGCPIGPYDALLAGQAVSTGLVLVTANVDEFSRVKALKWENWRAA